MKVKDRSPVNVPIQDMPQQQITITVEALWAMKTAASDCSSDGTPPEDVPRTCACPLH